jgi:hypothetical protein
MYPIVAGGGPLEAAQQQRCVIGLSEEFTHAGLSKDQATRNWRQDKVVQRLVLLLLRVSRYPFSLRG